MPRAFIVVLIGEGVLRGLTFASAAAGSCERCGGVHRPLKDLRLMLQMYPRCVEARYMSTMISRRRRAVSVREEATSEREIQDNVDRRGDCRRSHRRRLGVPREVRRRRRAHRVERAHGTPGASSLRPSDSGASGREALSRTHRSRGPECRHRERGISMASSTSTTNRSSPLSMGVPDLEHGIRNAYCRFASIL